MTKLRTKLTGMSDQLWMEVEEFLPDIKRIAETGVPESQRDVSIIQKCFCLLAGEIHVRRGDRKAGNHE